MYKDDSLCSSINNALSLDSHKIVNVQSTEALTDLAYRDTLHLLIIDSTLLNYGSGVCRQLRAIPRLERVPFLALANSQSAQEIAHALDSGCDDCVRKPIIERELAARVRALLRRKTTVTATTQIALDGRQKVAYLGEKRLDLTPTEYSLLEVLCDHSGQHITTADLLEKVWNYPPETGDPALVRNHVRNLRRKLEDDPDHPRIVVCLQGRGYSVSGDIRRC